MYFVLLVFAFFSISPAISTDWDPFKFYFTITCRHHIKPYYWYSVQFLEEDNFSTGEWITQKYEEYFAAATLFKTFEGAMNGDEILSIAYDVTAIFQHDCTANGEKVEVQFEFQQKCELRKPCNMDYNADLTDKYGYYKV